MDPAIRATVSKDGDIPDSTDWIGTPLASLMPVEQAFRCHVCKDFYNSPMITSCNHTFCSLCIRRCLAVEGKCPLCRATDQESKLRGNWALREAVDAFCQARIAVLAVARNPPRAITSSQSPKRKAREDEDSPGSQRPRKSARLSKTRGAETTAAMAMAEAQEPEIKDSRDYEPDDGLVECPICRKRMKLEQVDRHIDAACSWPAEPQAKSQQVPSAPKDFGGPNTTWNTVVAPKPPEHLPWLSYGVLNDVNLKKKMAALGISTSGNRPLLESRHKEWVTIWNANCDSAFPKRKADLLRDLDIWERTVGGRAPTMSRSANIGAEIKDKDFDGAAWSAKYEPSFKDLIAMARSSRSKANPKTAEKPSSSVNSQSDNISSFSSSNTLPNQTKMSTETIDLISIPSSQSEYAPLQPVVNGEITGPVDKGAGNQDEHKIPYGVGQHVSPEEWAKDKRYAC